MCELMCEAMCHLMGQLSVLCLGEISQAACPPPHRQPETTETSARVDVLLPTASPNLISQPAVDALSWCHRYLKGS